MFVNQLTDMTHLLEAESYLTNVKKQLKIARYELIKIYFELENAVGGKLENE
jgi:outer membrane protein TolC